MYEKVEEISPQKLIIFRAHPLFTNHQQLLVFVRIHHGCSLLYYAIQVTAYSSLRFFCLLAFQRGFDKQGKVSSNPPLDVMNE